MGPVARAGIAAGADGLIVEVHKHPEDALSDGGQSLKPEKLAELVKQVHSIAQAIGRDVAPRHALVATATGDAGRVLQRSILTARIYCHLHGLPCSVWA